MKKKILIDQLKPGMHVVSTNRNWLQIPFFRKKIRSTEIIEKLKSYHVTEVVIDTDKGLDISPGTESREVKPADHPEVLHENLSQSAAVHDKVFDSTAKLMENVRQGKTISEEEATQQVDLLIDQIFDDSHSMLCMSVLKSSNQFIFSHCVNLSILTLFVGKYLNYSRQELLHLGKGALFHDIGTCMLPQSILSKPARLNDDENKIVQSHVKHGVNYLKKMGSASEEVILFTQHHHERMKGQGYPAGLTGDEISWYGRLGAVLDVYDALVHKNYYKDSEDPRTVLDQLAKSVGDQFDPKAFEALTKCLGLYPPGTMLMLDSGEIGVSFEPNEKDPERPKILLVMRADGSFFDHPEAVDLMEADADQADFKRSIITSVTPEDTNFNPFDVLENFSPVKPEM